MFIGILSSPVGKNNEEMVYCGGWVKIRILEHYSFNRLQMVSFECPRITHPLVSSTFEQFPFPIFCPWLLPSLLSLQHTQECRFMEKRLREISRFFVASRREFAPAVRARPRTPFSINTSTSVHSYLLQIMIWTLVVNFCTMF